jgi:CopG family transcriptional regulator, nickel-responsive regulator
LGKELTVISITLPPELLKKFDEFVESRGYFSRSAGFRNAIRNLISEADLAKFSTGKVAATVMTTSDYARKDVDLRIADLRHEFDDVVIENVHRHIDGKYCVEIFVAEGSNDRILHLINRLRGMHGIQQVRAMFMPL